MSDKCVYLYIYDLSNGMARSLSQALIGQQIDGVWHTSIGVFGKEILFGGMGIQQSVPGATPAGRPHKIERLGLTEIENHNLNDLLSGMLPKFDGANYHLTQNNCNTFSQELSVLLTGKDIPSYITSLPERFLATPFGKQFMPLFEQTMQGQSIPGISSNASTQNTQFNQNTPNSQNVKGISEKAKNGPQSQIKSISSEKNFITSSASDDKVKIYVDFLTRNQDLDAKEKEIFKWLPSKITSYLKKASGSDKTNCKNAKTQNKITDRFFEENGQQLSFSLNRFLRQILQAPISESSGKLGPLREYFFYFLALLRLVVLCSARVREFFTEKSRIESLVIYSQICDESCESAVPTKIVLISFLCNSFSSKRLERVSELAENECFIDVISKTIYGESPILLRKSASCLLWNCVRGLSQDVSEEKNIRLIMIMCDRGISEEDAEIKKRVRSALQVLVSGSSNAMVLLENLGFNYEDFK